MIRIYDTRQRAKVPFEPRKPGQVTMYVCGPTVYDRCHIGHARPAVVFDTARRYLEYAGYSVTFISNITDIDDKIINRSNQLGISWRFLASRYQDEYERDMAALGVRSPTIRPRATEHIPEMIELIHTLEGRGIAYVTPRGVWFDVNRFPGYGSLSGRTADDETTEHRVEQDPDKRNPQDFALWKLAKPGEPSWPSPWGAGRPGWHIECSAMAGRYGDFQLDLHGGGADLAFPHHENEIAQAEAAMDPERRPFVNLWMHNGFITVGKDDGADEKMGKSKGNAFWLREAFALASPAALRWWILTTHYRAPLQYRPSLLQDAANSLDRVYTCLEALERKAGEEAPDAASTDNSEDARRQTVQDAIRAADDGFRQAMNDDFNTPQALAVVHELVGKANAAVAEGMPGLLLADYRSALTELLNVLGLPLERPADSAGGKTDDLVKLLVDLRAEARKEKNFALSDAIRDRLNAIGVELNDRGGQTTWTVK